jgi:hypothetical protein
VNEVNLKDLHGPRGEHSYAALCSCCMQVLHSAFNFASDFPSIYGKAHELVIAFCMKTSHNTEESSCVGLGTGSN